MNALTTWNPFREMEELQNRLSNIFTLPASRYNGEQESLTVSQWAPTVDIIEDDNAYCIKAELPGLTKDNVKVTVENGQLTISGQREFKKEEKGQRYHRIERAYGNFVRSFTLPDDANNGKVSAEFKDGVLTVHVAKSEHARPKLIEVKVS